MLGKLKKVLFGDRDSNEVGMLKESRYHPRYGMEALSFLSLEFPAGHFHQVRDISYGGISFSRPEQLEPVIRGTLHLFDENCSIFARKVHEDRTQLGYQFIHDDAHVLVFLRSFLEDLRCGSTLTLLKPELLKESYQNSYNMILRGDGPTDLMLDFSNGKLHSALMTQRSSSDYQEVRWNRDVLQTGRAMDEAGSAPRIVTDKNPNPEVLKKALQTLAGFTVTSRTTIPALTEFYRIVEEARSSWQKSVI